MYSKCVSLCGQNMSVFVSQLFVCAKFICVVKIFVWGLLVGVGVWSNYVYVCLVKVCVWPECVCVVKSSVCMLNTGLCICFSIVYVYG